MLDDSERNVGLTVSATCGGSGSTYLTHRGLAERPDAQLATHTMYELSELSPDILEAPPSRRISDWVRKRAGYVLDESLTIGENFEAYLRTGPNVLFCRLAVTRFFSSRRIEGVVFLARHPEAAFMSFCKPERHWIDVKCLGIRDRLRIFGGHWRANLEEYSRCRDQGLNPAVLRFESFDEDARAATLITGRDVDNLAVGFDMRRSDSARLPAEQAEYLWSVIGEDAATVYSTGE